MTILLIVCNVAVSVFQWTLPGGAGRSLTMTGALIPARLFGSHLVGVVPPLATLLTSQFLHGGLLHLAGNMFFLWIFGNNIEDEMGPYRFLAFYLLCGTIAGLVHCASQPASTVPTVGASGAISGVLGAYAVLFPRARIHTLVFLVIYVTVLPIPALLWVAVWFVFQLLQGIGSSGAAGGVAWFAHVGGAIAGVPLVLLFRRRKRGVRRTGPFTDFDER
jgi:membrane associated rhomboid family serine protease